MLKISHISKTFNPGTVNAKLALDDEEIDKLDITRYMAAVEAILALDDMAGADVLCPSNFRVNCKATARRASHIRFPRRISWRS